MRHALTYAAMSIALALSAPNTRGENAAPQARCFDPTALGAVSGERTPQRGIHKYDRLPAAQEPLAAFAPIPAALRGAIRRVDVTGGEKLVALTFDLCEQYGEVAGYDGGIFDYLRAENIRATLFAGGKWLRSHPERTAQLISDPLFEIANHSEAHRNLRLLDAAAMATEIRGPQQSYEAARKALSQTQCKATAAAPDMTHVAPRLGLFRFPYGACNAASLAAVNDAGLLAIQWDLSSGDPDPRIGADAMANSILRRIKPGSIIVMHGNGRGWNTAAALPILIPKLKARGFAFVTISELLARGTPVIATTCYDSKSGDTDRYDHPLSLTGAAKTQTSQNSSPANASWHTTTAVKTKRSARVPKDVLHGRGSN